MKNIFVVLVALVGIYGLYFIQLNNITYISEDGKVIKVDDMDRVPECPKGMKREVLSHSSYVVACLCPSYINLSECKTTK